MFDSVNRRLLIESLLKIGLSSCFVAIIADMYRRVKFVVKVMGNFSRLVTSHVGVEQGALSDVLYLPSFSPCLLRIKIVL